MTVRKAIPLGAFGFGVLAALAYATQHPLQQPLLRDFADQLDSVAFAVLSGELVGVLVVLGLVLFRGSRSEIFRLFMEPRVHLKLLAIATLNSLSLVFYFVAIRTYDVVPVSTILNLFPFYALIVSVLIWKAKPNRSSILIFGGVAVSILTIGASDENQTFSSSVMRFLLVSSVPIIFSVVNIAKAKWFQGYRTVTYISVVAVFDAVIFVPATLFLLCTSDSFEIYQVFRMPSLLSAFCVGAVLSGFLAQYLLQKAFQANTSRVDYATAPFFMIPILSGLIGVALGFFGIGDSQGFTRENLAAYTVFAFGFLLFYFWDSIGARLKTQR